MKRFNELTLNQQEQAISYAESEFYKAIHMGMVMFKTPPTKEAVRDYAISAAEDAWYSEKSDEVIADIADGK